MISEETLYTKNKEKQKEMINMSKQNELFSS